ncbi:E3 ISG15--protein ligase HERC5-like [Gopherus flavomarginatus]|uniref:E3 ISG15--protein ligase HERC5-like n=1 Tax=Gopherus flavomarginatus TaxID=286002 RepID=UPI0021CBB390|nr:E3 ISG15--protein ligase HERC5-like [Gopherus flavomarginatus]
MSYCWGAGSWGQLGLGEAAAAGPVRCRPGPEPSGGWTLLEAACGEHHTLLLRPDGTVCSCGANARGQLGRKLRPGQRGSYTPEQIQALEAQIIVHVSCGKEHSLAVCNRGKVFSWGAGSEGQLGTGEFKEQSLIPKKIDGLSALRIIQVTCGHFHSVALAQDGRVFSWGQNTHGQLGLGQEIPSQHSPQHVTSLSGIPVAQVAAGGGHTFALSLSGVVYGWGRNNARQLGLSHANRREQVFKPYAVAALTTIGVVYISCGDEHTAVLTQQDGSVFTFGDDSAGQLGHHSSTQIPGPQKVEWLDGPVSHLACGSYHTLVYMSTPGQVISFGRGPQRHIENGTGEQAQNFDISSLVSANDLSGVQVKMIFAGTYVNFVSTLQSQDLEHARGISPADTLQKISRLDRTLINKWMAVTVGTDEFQEAKREIAVIFSSPACLNASFLKPSSALDANCIGVDLQKARDVFDELTKKEWIVNQINYCLLADLIPGLPLHSPHREALSIFLLLPECSVMYKEQNLEPFVLRLAQAINSMSDRSSNILEKCWMSLSASFLDTVVQMFKKAVVSQLTFYTSSLYRGTKPLLEVLEKLYRANRKANYTLQLSNFYIDEISGTFILPTDVGRWRSWQATANSCHEDDVPVIFCRFPFVFNLVSKTQVFHFDSIFKQEGAKLAAEFILKQNELLRKSELPELPVFPLQVKRSSLVEDTLRKLSLVEDSVLKKQLLVQFEGELGGLDAGGVILEFFLYLFEEMVNPQYGMFVYCDPASPMWFPTSVSQNLLKPFRLENKSKSNKMPRCCQTGRRQANSQPRLVSAPLQPAAVASSSLLLFPKPNCHPNFFKKHPQEICQINCKESSLVVVEKNGSVLVFDKEGEHRKLQCVNSGKDSRVHSLDCGAAHILILSSEGKLISATANKSEMRLLKELRDKYIVQISCGDHHSMALSKGGELFTWGQNSHGQLGVGNQIAFTDKPQLVQELRGIPLAQIATGGTHSLVLSLSGAVYSWGKNDFGQLGLGDTENKYYPSYIRALEHKKTVYISCGGEHTAVLSQDGLVCTFGAGDYGQLGHNSTQNELTPRIVAELFGARVSQIACGRWHTLVYVPSLEKVYSFGCGAEGQLGNGDTSNQLIPLPVELPSDWVNGGKVNQGNSTSKKVIKIIAGGNQSIVLCLKKKNPYVTLNGTATAEDKEVDKWISNSDPKQWENIKKTIWLIFSSEACVNGSFLDKSRDKHFRTSKEISGMDMSAVLLFYEKMNKKPRVFQEMISAVKKLLSSLSSSPSSPEALRLYLIIPVLLRGQDNMSDCLLDRLAAAILSLQQKDLKVLESLWSNLEISFFKDLVSMYQRVSRINLSLFIIQARNSEEVTCEPHLNRALKMLQILYQVNSSAGFKIQENNFYIPEVKRIWGQDWRLNEGPTYEQWIKNEISKRLEMRALLKLTAYPCIFDMQDKIVVYEIDRQILFGLYNTNSFLPRGPWFLEIRRAHLVDDVWQNLRSAAPKTFEKFLQVQFVGEQGIDVGGLSQEFFTIITRELCCPEAQIFRCFEDSNLIWFPSQVPGSEDTFFLIGTLFGMALYNMKIAPFHFPLALYKKLLDIPPTLEDLKELSPTEGRNLQEILDEDYDDILENMMIDFTIMKKQGGSIVSIELKENGADIPITKHNRKEYVDAYVNYVFNESVKKPFEDFRSGFLRGCPAKKWKLFLPIEFLTVFRGHTKYDWKLLEENTKYKDYEKSDQTIKNFWTVFHELPEEKKKNFLAFLTGTDRIPAEGMRHFQFTIADFEKENPDLFHPIANTCYHVLMLPRYSNEEILREKFLNALEFYEKFSLS